jgi:signal transduction histidine kinase
MSLKARLFLLALAACAVTLAVFWAALLAGGRDWQAALAAGLAGCAASAGLAALAGSRLAAPLQAAADSVKKFIAADYRLEAPLPKAGWPEAARTVSGLNRLMLELSAYRGFRLDQVLEERAKAEAMIETIADGVLLADDAGRIICANKLALSELGISKGSSEPLPGTISNQAFLPAIAASMKSEEDLLTQPVEVPSGTAPGESKSFLVVSSRFIRATMRRAGRVIVIRDVSLEKEIEKTKETFFQMITHDMRAPLASIIGYAQMLQRSLKGAPEGERCLESITRAAARLTGMISDILDVTRLERGDMRLQPAPVVPRDLIARVCETHAPVAKRRGVRLSAAGAADVAAFTGDPGLLERVLSNLTGNALKFTPAGGSITLSCRPGSGENVFCVEDTGPGIPADKQSMIFGKYAQMEEHRDFGFGLGLAICKMAVELHGGRIWVESEPGKGSRFIFSVPGAA